MNPINEKKTLVILQHHCQDLIRGHIASDRSQLENEQDSNLLKVSGMDSYYVGKSQFMKSNTYAA